MRWADGCWPCMLPPQYDSAIEQLDVLYRLASLCCQATVNWLQSLRLSKPRRTAEVRCLVCVIINIPACTCPTD